MRGRTLIEHHDDVGAEGILHGHAALGVEANKFAVDVAFEGDAVVVDLVEVGEGEDLESAAVGEDRAGPGHEFVEIAQCRDGFLAGAEHEVVGVSQDYLRTGGGELIGENAFDCALRTDGHEGGRVEDAMRRGDAAEASAGGVGEKIELKSG